MNRLLLFLAIALLSFGNDLNAENIVKGILLRSKETVNYTVSERIKKADSQNEGWFYYEYNDVQKHEYEEFTLMVTVNYTDEAASFLNNSYLQEDLATFASVTNSKDSLGVAMLNHAKGKKTIDEVINELKNIDGYNAFVLDEANKAEFNVERNKYPNSKRCNFIKNINVSAKNGIIMA